MRRLETICCHICCHSDRQAPLGNPGGAFSRGKSGAPGGIRTPDHLIRSQMLYPLSYGRAVCGWFHAHLEHLIRLAGPS